jgi:putative phosphoesterase
MTRLATVGVISDTHGLLRPEALAALAGLDAIVHAGDVGSPEILQALSALAPVTAVRGNNDRERWARTLPETAVVEIGGVRLYVLHDVKELGLDPRARGFAAVVSGHSHQARAETRDGVLFFNPGSAGPRRFRLPICVGRLTIASGQVRGRIVELEVPLSQLTPRSRKDAAGDRGGARAWR